MLFSLPSHVVCVVLVLCGYCLKSVHCVSSWIGDVVWITQTDFCHVFGKFNLHDQYKKKHWHPIKKQPSNIISGATFKNLMLHSPLLRTRIMVKWKNRKEYLLPFQWYSELTNHVFECYIFITYLISNRKINYVCRL